MVYIALQRKEIAVGDLYTDQTKDVLFFKLHMIRLSKKSDSFFFCNSIISRMSKHGILYRKQGYLQQNQYAQLPETTQASCTVLLKPATTHHLLLQY